MARAGLKKHFGTWTEKQRQTLLAAALPLAVFFITLAFFGIRYETNDDATLSNIAAGAYGSGSQYLIYVNILLGWLLKPFYFLLPSLNWYVILQLCAALGCCFLLCRTALQKLGCAKGSLLCMAMLLLAGIDLFSSFQYVKISGLLLLTGLFLITLQLGTLKPGLWGGMALALAGSMLRFDNFFAVGALSAAALLWRFFQLDKPGKKRAVLAMLLLFALVFGAKGVDLFAYRLSPGWQEYLRYNQARTLISDYRLQFLEDKTALADYGYSVNDYDMLNHWSYYDPEVFPVEKLEEVASFLPRRALPDAFKETVYTGIHFFYGEPVFLLLGLTALGWVFFSGKKSWPYALGILAMLGLLLFYLCWQGRLPHRVEWVLAVSAAVFLLLCFTPGKRGAGMPVLCMGLASLCLVTAPYFETLRKTALAYPETHPAYVEDFDAMSADKERLYLVDIELLNFIAGFDVWHARPKDYFSNIVVLGGWTSGTPFDAAALARFGYQNPYRALAGGDERVLLADFYNLSAKEIYLQEHYGFTGEREEVKELSLYPFRLYRLSLKGGAVL